MKAKRGIDQVFQNALEQRELEAGNPECEVIPTSDGGFFLIDKRIEVPDSSGLSKPGQTREEDADDET